MLNRINLNALKESGEIEDHHITELLALARSLGLKLDYEGRVAPSIILRSELQLFGCAAPRFAYRVYFDQANGEPAKGFVNIRRLARFSKSIRVEGIDHAELARILSDQSQSCIADCLLPRPFYLPPEKFHLIQSKLSTGYGETAANYGIEDYAGTPFVKCISLGGGVCAQACAFMATAMLHDYAKSVHGFAEITALAYPRRRKFLNISGLNLQRMQRYFENANLAMTAQCAVGVARAPTKTLDQAKAKEFECALKSYCRSNMPIIVPMDMGRMLGFPSLREEDSRKEGKDIYKVNGFTLKAADLDRTRTRQHCVVVVGYKTAVEEGTEDTFVFNDPSAHPFMYAKTSLITNSGAYAGALRDTTDPFQFWAITPGPVKMPLLNFERPRASGHQPGLKWMSWWHRNNDGARPLTSREPSDNFKLMQLREISRASQFDPAPQKVWSRFREDLKSVCDRLVDTHFYEMSHWVWLEIMDTGIWIWDAEIEPNYLDPAECLLAEIHALKDDDRIQFPSDYEIG